MTREELINHLEHLADYVKYSEDAPALREVIKMLMCSEMPNGSEEHTQERTETHACDCISRQAAIDALGEKPLAWTEGEYELGMQNQWQSDIDALKELPSARPDSSTCWGCNCHKMQLLEKDTTQPEPHEIGYSECADAMLKMWIDNVLTDGEYNRIMDKLNAHWTERREDG